MYGFDGVDFDWVVDWYVYWVVGNWFGWGVVIGVGYDGLVEYFVVGFGKGVVYFYMEGDYCFLIKDVGCCVYL